jgi:hypothetical protein
MEEMNVYEEQVTETNEGLIPIEAEPEEEAGLGTLAVVAITSAATATLIWAGNKVRKFVKKRKARKAAAELAAEIEEIFEEVEEEPVPEENDEA